jgi:putative flippase GtrA
MTVVYMIGVTQTFIVNRNWVFYSSQASHRQFLRYIAVYGAGYIINWSILYVAVDLFRENHLIAQCASILIVALFSFLMLKKFVFAVRHENSI